MFSSTDKPVEDWTDIVDRDWLTAPVTLQSYFTTPKWSGADDVSKIVKLEARAQHGDQWWEWVSGNEPLMQMGGIALVRDGTIVYAELNWLS